MFQARKYYDLIRPLSVGNVVNVSFFIYRTHWKSYFGLALRANFWLILPISSIFLVWTLVFKSVSAETSAVWVLLLIIPSIIALTYGCAKFLTASALISRLVFNELMGQPENIKDAKQQVNSRIWLFLITGILVTLILLFFIFALIMIISLIWFILLLGIGLIQIYIVNINTIRNHNILILIALIILLLIIATFMAFLTGLTWIYSRFLITEVPLAIENNISPGRAIGRNWELTKKSTARIQGVITITFLITLPIHLPIQIIGAVLQTSNSFFSGQLYALIVIGLSLVSGALLVPFWQAIKAVVYYDLCIRQEGLGMQPHFTGASERKGSRI